MVFHIFHVLQNIHFWQRREEHILIRYQNISPDLPLAVRRPDLRQHVSPAIGGTRPLVALRPTSRQGLPKYSLWNTLLLTLPPSGSGVTESLALDHAPL